eukprot:Nk52_evm23s208 gene=Nk52_evmTU23s208
MAEKLIIVSALPPPPEYYKNYSDTEVQRESCPKPPRPLKGTYSVFGTENSFAKPLILSLEEQNCERVYMTDTSRVEELKKLNHAILFNFLELLKILTENPAVYEEKVKDLELLFVNMHHLINEFRPHQAMETIRSVLEYQRDKRKAAGQELRLWLERAKKSLGKCQSEVFPKADEVYRKYADYFNVVKEVEMENAEQLMETEEYDHIERAIDNVQLCEAVRALNGQLTSL